MGSSTPFVEEIDFNEIEIQEVVGKGSFGVVNKGKWRDKYVAVKMISSENERKAFIVELRQLSRVDHHNIVKLYGACQNKPVCLVMEYAEGGSLYNVLHGKPQPEYIAAHAISWALQCARGVAYLHGMKPKALIHRDLKPPNLLLIMGGTVLKICDFGTACDIQTHMTNNKGSAAWMAPEVFEGSSYSEKCDVFSWGIILWEVITRQKPFDDIRGSAYQILWAVHSGKRPPLIRRCPKPLNILMSRCWKKEPQERPSMDEVVNIMAHLSVFFKGADQPIKYPLSTEVEEEEDGDSAEDDDLTNYDSREVTYGSEGSSQVIPETTGSSDQSTHKDTSSRKGSNETLAFSASSILINRESRISQTSAPASLASSKEDIRSDIELTLGSNYTTQKNVDKAQKRLSADVTGLVMTPKPAGHQRSGSYGSNFVANPNPSSSSTSTENQFKPDDKRRNSEDLHNQSQRSYPNPGFPLDLKLQSEVKPLLANHWVQSHAHNPPSPFKPSPDTIENAYRLLDPHLQPLSPYHGSRESKQLFEEHKKMAYEYLQVQTEFALLQQRKNELANLLNKRDANNIHYQPDGNALISEYDNLMKEKESLKKLHENLKQQLAITRSQQQNRQ